MPFCLKCRAEYLAPTMYCETCKIPLVGSLPQSETPDDAGGLDLVELARFSNVSEAEMIKELLEKNEVHAILRGEIDPIGVVSGAEPTTLLVEARDFAHGQELYEAYFAGNAIEQSPEG